MEGTDIINFEIDGVSDTGNYDDGEDVAKESLADMLKFLSSSPSQNEKDHSSYPHSPCVSITPKSCSSIIEDFHLNGYGPPRVKERDRQCISPIYSRRLAQQHPSHIKGSMSLNNPLG